MCNPYDIANYGVSRQPPDHTAQTRSHGTNQVTRDKSGTKRDLQAPHGGPGYGVTVHICRDKLSLDSPFNPEQPPYQPQREGRTKILFQSLKTFQAEHFRLKSCYELILTCYS